MQPARLDDTAIGAFQHAKLGWYDLDAKTYRDIATCARRDGSTVGGQVQQAAAPTAAG